MKHGWQSLGHLLGDPLVELGNREPLGLPDKRRVLDAPLVLRYAVKELLHAQDEPKPQVPRVFLDAVAAQDACYLGKRHIVVALERLSLKRVMQYARDGVKVLPEPCHLALNASSFLEYTDCMFTPTSRPYFDARKYKSATDSVISNLACSALFFSIAKAISPISLTRWMKAVDRLSPNFLS